MAWSLRTMAISSTWQSAPRASSMVLCSMTVVSSSRSSNYLSVRQVVVLLWRLLARLVCQRRLFSVLRILWARSISTTTSICKTLREINAIGRINARTFARRRNTWRRRLLNTRSRWRVSKPRNVLFWRKPMRRPRICYAKAMLPSSALSARLKRPKPRRMPRKLQGRKWKR